MVRWMVLCVLVLASCQAAAEPGAPPRDIPVTSRGHVVAAFADAAVDLDVAGLPADVALAHRQDLAGGGCVVQATMVAQRKDGSCRLALVFRPWIGSGGLHLDEAQFHVRASAGDPTPPCSGWPDEPLAVDGEAIVYKLHDGNATLSVPNVHAKAGAQTTLVPGALLQPQGVITFKYQGRKFDLDLGKLSFGGDVVSTGVQATECGPCKGPQCTTPYPKFQLQDVQPKSPNFGLVYGLEVFAGKPLVVLPVAGWCTTCVYEAPRLQHLHDQLAASGHGVPFVAINMANASSPQLQQQIVTRYTIPVLQDTAAANAFGVLDAEKTDVYLYQSDGTLAEHMKTVIAIDTDTSPNYVKVKDAILALH